MHCPGREKRRFRAHNLAAVWRRGVVSFFSGGRGDSPPQKKDTRNKHRPTVGWSLPVCLSAVQSTAAGARGLARTSARRRRAPVNVDIVLSSAPAPTRGPCSVERRAAAAREDSAAAHVRWRDVPRPRVKTVPRPMFGGETCRGRSWKVLPCYNNDFCTDTGRHTFI